MAVAGEIMSTPPSHSPLVAMHFTLPREALDLFKIKEEEKHSGKKNVQLQCILRRFNYAMSDCVATGCIQVFKGNKREESLKR